MSEPGVWDLRKDSGVGGYRPVGPGSTLEFGPETHSPLPSSFYLGDTETFVPTTVAQHQKTVIVVGPISPQAPTGRRDTSGT